ncbi:MAG: hypothetical protein IT435_13090 [Phycisphaerales bacterium]|nr:hypothetical protein [Phycisphaerales bacterium]
MIGVDTQRIGWAGIALLGAAIGCAKQASTSPTASKAAADATPTPTAPATPPTPADSTSPVPATDPWLTPFPHVRLNPTERIVEFDGVVPIDPHDPETPTIFLEVIACSRNTREHEALVVTDAKPSHIHAALLLAGLEPGSPGTWSWDNNARRMSTTPPKGPEVQVRFIHSDHAGTRIESNPADWIIDVRDRRSLTSRAGRVDPVWVFAGSAIALRPDGPGEYYKADIEGTLVGLATFGTETLAWPGVFSPEAVLQPPEWIADPARVPPYKTLVTVRLRPIGAGG